nr:uncharacterized protein LOC118879791 isoform X2 [Drosophila suzukii]
MDRRALRKFVSCLFSPDGNLLPTTGTAVDHCHLSRPRPAPLEDWSCPKPSAATHQ